MGLAGRCSFILFIACSLCAALAGCGGGGGQTTPPDGNQPNGNAIAAAVAQLNSYRAMGSLLPVSADPTLCLGAQQHANYLTLNQVSLSQIGLAAHDQIPGRPGYTALGDAAGHNSVIYQGVTPVEAIHNWTRTLYHRLGMFDPNLQLVGFGSLGEFQVLDIGQGVHPGPNFTSAVVVFPFPGMTGVNGEYKREIPHPIPTDDSIGIPITVEFFGLKGMSIQDVSTQVTNLASGQRISAYVQYPGKPFLPDWDLRQLIAIIPSSPLPQGSTFLVDVVAEVDGFPFTAQWQFSTR